MIAIKDRYQIVETSHSLSFQPFYHRKKKLKWYVIALLILGALYGFYFNLMSENIKIICSLILFIDLYLLLQELILQIPLKYKFDKATQAVYHSNFFHRQKKIMNLQDMAILPSSTTGSWHYAIGEKRNQFVKNYPISENFGDSKKCEERIAAFEEHILAKIEEMISTK